MCLRGTVPQDCMVVYLHKLDTVFVASLDCKAEHSREASLHLSLGHLVAWVGRQTRVVDTLYLEGISMCTITQQMSKVDKVP